MNLRKSLRAALESVQENDTQDDLVNLSDFDVTELPASENDITRDLDELTEISDKTESLETLCITLEAIGSPTAIQTALATTTYQQIMYNTDRRVPSLEAGGFVRDVKESVEAFIKRAKEILAGLWRKLLDFMYGLFSLLPMRIRKLESLRKEINDADESGVRDVTPTRDILDGLSVGSGKVDWGAINKGIAVLHKESAFYLKDYMAVVRETARKMSTGRTVEDLVTAAKPHYNAVARRYRAVMSQGTELSRSDSMPGGYYVEVTAHELQHGLTDTHLGDETVAMAAAQFTVYKTRLRVKRDEAETVSPAALPGLGKQEVLKLLDDTILQLKLYVSHFNQYRQFSKQIDNAYGGWATQWLSASARNEENKFNTGNIVSRSMSAFSTLADWTKEPVGGLLTTSIRFSNAVAAYGAKWLKTTEDSTSSESVPASILTRA